jgi:NitT/TauT family transport system ATP-binding protein
VVAGLQTAIQVRDVTMTYPLGRRASVTALERVDLDVRDGEFVALIGPSGCGKSTLLRLVAGLEAASAGTVSIGDQLPSALVNRHRIGVAFQDHALLPWLSASGNIALSFHAAGLPVDHGRIAELIRLVGLEGFESARPKHLSGGMRQRVSIARALALRPDVLLLDEPFGALDAVTRRRLNLELQRIWFDQSVTTLLVTHDVEEAVFLADRVVVLTGRPGRVRVAIDVPLGRPRPVEVTRTLAFHALVDRLTAALDSDAEDQSANSPEPMQMVTWDVAV